MYLSNVDAIQGGVYDLLNPDGTKAKVVFKVRSAMRAFSHQHMKCPAFQELLCS